jgi:hypothetical protein
MSILPCSRLHNSFKNSLLQLPGRWSVKSPYFCAQQHWAYSETIPNDDDSDDDNNNIKAKNILNYKNLTIEI